MADLQNLQKALAYQFDDDSLLALALTHRSYGSQNNERLEFLGDALLSATISQSLFQKFPNEKEGMLSRLRASLVKGDTLAVVGRELNLSDHLIMGEGELKSGGFRRDSILADAVEAIIGAVYLDGGMEQCQNFIKHLFDERLATISTDKPLKDPKTRLQEWLQARQLPLPNYLIVHTEGESHDQVFTVRCETSILDEHPQATASSRRQAEKQAAAKVLALVEK